MRADGSNINKQELPGMITLGYVSGVFGIRGELKVFLYNPQTDLFKSAREITLLFENGSQKSTSLKVRPGAGKKILGVLPELNNPQQAAAYVGAKICIPAEELPSLQDDEWYHFQLLNLPVHTQSQRYLGTIVEIISSQVDIWVVQGSEEELWYVPNEESHIVSVCVDQEEASEHTPFGVVICDFDDEPDQ